MRVEPVGRLITREQNYLATMIGHDIGIGVHGTQGEGLPDRRLCSTDTCHTEPAMILHREQPLVQPLLLRVFGISELAPFRATIINWPAARFGAPCRDPTYFGRPCGREGGEGGGDCWIEATKRENSAALCLGRFLQPRLTDQPRSANQPAVSKDTP